MTGKGLISRALCYDADMPRKLYPHVHRQRTRHGKWVYYYREGKGKRIRLPNPNDPGFREAYLRACAGEAPKVSRTREGTLKWLWERYTTESAKWAAYGEGTKRQRTNIMRKILATNADKALSVFTPDVIQAGIDRRHETPAAAKNFLKTMRGLFEWAKRMRLVAIDPTIGSILPEYRSQGFHPWTIEDVAKFREAHPVGTHERLAMELMLLAGLRRSDVVRVGRQHIAGRVLTIDTAKTGERVSVELSDDLLRLIDATPRKGLHLIESSKGRPFVKESFGNWFREACDKAGIKKSAHGLRKLSATLAAEGGAATHQLMAQYGWTNIATAEIYTKSIDRKRLGIEASRIVADQIENRITPHPVSGEGIAAKKSTKSNS